MEDVGPWYWVVHDRVGQAFEHEFQQLVGFHRAHKNAIAAAYERAIDEAAHTLDPESHDTLAKVAAVFFTDAEGIVFTNGKAWTRASAVQFYKTMLRKPYNIDALGLDVISDLRNTYAHGYGTFATSEAAKSLEARLLAIIDSGPATDQEIADGYGSQTYVLGQHSRSLAEFLEPEADLSPLTVHRLLGVIQRTIEGAIAAAGDGLRDGESLMRVRFLRDWAKRTGYDRDGDKELAYEGPVEIRFEGKRVDVFKDDDGQPINLVHLMADGPYIGRIELTART